MKVSIQRLIPSIIFLLAGVLFFLILSDRFSQYALTEMERFAQTSVDQSGKNIDFLIGKLKGFSYTVYNDPSIQKWLGAKELEPFEFVAASVTLDRFLATEPYIHSAYLINSHLDSIFDSRTRLSRLSQFHDTNITRALVENAGTYASLFNHTIGDLSYLALAQPTSSASQGLQGVLVLLIDKDLLATYLLQDSGVDGVEAFLVDGKGNPLVGKPSEKAKDILRLSSPSGNPIQVLTMGSETWLVGTGKIANQDWSLRRLWRVDILRAQGETFRYSMAGTSLLLVLGLFLLLIWERRRVLNPFRKLAREMRYSIPHSLQTQAKDDLSILQQGLASYKKQSKEHDREQAMGEWLTSGSLSSQDARQHPELSRLWNSPTLTLVQYRLETYHEFESAHSLAERRRIKLFILEQATISMTKHCTSIAGIDLGSDHVILLLGTTSSDVSSDLIGDIDSLRTELGRVHQVPTVSSCLVIDEPQGDIRPFLSQLYEHSLLKYYFGRDKTYGDQDFDEFISLLPSEGDGELVDSIVDAVRLGKNDLILELIPRLLKSCQRRTFLESQTQLTLAIYGVLKPFSKLSSAEEAGGLRKKLDNFDSFADLNRWLGEELVSISERLTGARTNKKREEAVIEIIDYIEAHLGDFMLNLDQIADHVALSTRYVRQLFKESKGYNLTDYVMKRRIEKVQDLLAKTDANIQQIQEKSGFQSKSHFFMAFKRATGMTPEQYRSSHRLNS